MYAILGAIALFLLLYFGSHILARMDAHELARRIRRFGWIVLFVLAGLLLIPGLLVLSIPLAILGYTMLRRGGGGFRLGGGFGGPFGAGGYGQRSQKRPGQKSFVRTAHLEMALDHDTGQVDGQCVSGKFAGRPLSSMNLEELKELAMALQQGDPQEAALLAAYLNQRFPDWQAGAAGAGAAGAGGYNGARARRATGGMSIDEAYEVLGVERSASKDEIRSAHRNLMKKVHPDQGGSTYLAARINEAKEVLLSVR
ncbi:DnaJ domain-containing protein [Methyloligella sp. 2.7D]|uniref:DnaJ domain-containing protein n=1 Tax=unclassified Methyloligella TaxID=2625955 RepID=UPI0027386006|nr:DnaJ domain-containing protein [Methyloligella sp. GL2]